MDKNPGRSERLGRTEQEERYKQVLAVNPKDVDALCGYACFLSTVRDDFAGAAELYSTAVKTDPSRARRITVQLWADLWAMRMENERSVRVKDEWLDFFRKIDTDGQGRLDKKVVQDALKQTELILSPEDLEAVLQNNQVVYEKLAESLSKVSPPTPWSKAQMKLKQLWGVLRAKAEEVLLKVKVV